MSKHFTAIIQQDNNIYMSFCPELDIASQGDTIQEARKNLAEAIQLFLQEASPNELKERLNSEIYISSLEISVG